MAKLSKTQVDRLGDRLRNGPATEADLRLLDEYRRSFGPAYELVLRTLRERGQAPTGRFAKSTLSIVEKLRRESIRLSQMQDIAGCRVVVANTIEQEKLVSDLRTIFTSATFVDRRYTSSHGYRAVHIIVEAGGKPVEIQVRTALQHEWAELSEKAADVIDPAIKYGGGAEDWQKTLLNLSDIIMSFEKRETVYTKVNSDATDQLRLLILKSMRSMLSLLDAIEGPYP